MYGENTSFEFGKEKALSSETGFQFAEWEEKNSLSRCDTKEIPASQNEDNSGAKEIPASQEDFSDTSLSIQEVSDILRLPKSKIRYWQTQFPRELAFDRTNGGQRRFTVGDLKSLRRIRSLLEIEGYTIEGAKRKLNLLKDTGKNTIAKILEMALEEFQKGEEKDEIVNRYGSLLNSIAN